MSSRQVRYAPVAPLNSPQTNSAPSSRDAFGFDPWLLWVTLRRSWIWIIPIGLTLAAICGYAVYKNFNPEYEATHILEANHDYILFKGVINAPSNLARVEQQLLTNALVLDPVLEDPKVTESPSLRDPLTRHKNLRKRLTIGDAGTKQLLTVSYRESDPEYAAMVCNAVVESYLRQRQSFDNKRISDLEGWLRPAIDRWESEVSGHQQRVRELSQQAQGFDPFRAVSQVENNTSTMTSLFGQLTQIKGDEEVLRARIEATADQMKRLETEPVEQLFYTREPTAEEIEEFIQNDARIVALKTRQKQKQAQVVRMEDNDLVRINRSWYNSLVSDVESLKQQQEDKEEEIRDEAIAYLRDRLQREEVLAQEQSLAEMRAQLSTLISKRDALEQSFDAEKSRLEKFAGETVDLYFAQQQYKQAASILEKLNMRIASLRTERQRGASIQTLAKATPPSTPIEEIPWKMVIVAGGGAFMLPFMLALFSEFTVNRVSTADHIESRKLSPVLGEVAKLPTNIAVGSKRRVFEESVDSLRVNLLMSRDSNESRSIAVTSSTSGEGKSSLASQLAISIAKATGETVLLVDADVRNPDQHHLFGIDLGPGLVQVLSGQVSLENAVDRSLNGLVHVVPAGFLNASPHRLINPSAIKDLLDQALNKIGYRYVLFDTAPILSAGETLSVTSEVDTTLLCVMRDISRVTTVERTVKRLEMTGASLAGVVFNGVPSRQYAYRYGDYRYGDVQHHSAMQHQDADLTISDRS